MARGCASMLVSLAALLPFATSSFIGFIAHDNQTCSADEHLEPWNEKIFGVNIGGWLVLEPWITPSLFYQFLGVKDHNKIAMDSHSFCTALGSEEANKQLRRHWATWVTEEHIAKLASIGINSLRVPVGDWMFNPYEPFINCTEGSMEFLDELLGWADKYGLKVLFDVHSVRGSANGLDNGGVTRGLEWTSTLADVAADAVTFEHWPRRTAGWMGSFDRKTGNVTIDKENIEFTLVTLERIAERYADNDVVLGLEPVNEPWQFTPIEELKNFYFEGYKRVKKIAPGWRWIMHDSFRFDVKVWGGFMAGCPDVALDTHIYQAWSDPSTASNFYANACAQKNAIHKMELAFGPVIVGEWSLATDNCAMWLNGFNDNLPGYPKLPCKFVNCAKPYMGAEQPGAPPEAGVPLQGPFGTGVSGPIYGMCPVDRDWSKMGQPGRGLQPKAQTQLLNPAAANAEDDITDVIMTNLARKKIQGFALVAHGFFFWNFRTELEDQWSYLRSHERGWIPNADQMASDAGNACAHEDVHCTADTECSIEKIRSAMDYAVGYDSGSMDEFDEMSSTELRAKANSVFDVFWHAHDQAKEACGFDGAARLTTSPYHCSARCISETTTRNGMAYCVGYDETSVAKFQKLKGDKLCAKATQVFDDYWQQNRFTGATCDFGGAAFLADEVASYVEDGQHHHQDQQKRWNSNGENLNQPTASKPSSTRGFRAYEIARIVALALAGIVLFYAVATLVKQRGTTIRQCLFSRPSRRDPAGENIGLVTPSGANDKNLEAATA